MGYMHIENLYKCQDILAFKRCYALEKIHGASGSVVFNIEKPDQLEYDDGAEGMERFKALFPMDLYAKIKALGAAKVSIFGEVHGGSCHSMSMVYGKEMRFSVFDIQIDEMWLAVPNMADVAKELGLEVVYFEEGPTDMDWINAQMAAPSVQAKRLGMGDNHPREGVVLRPPFEVRKNNDERVIAKHKGEKFSERATPQKVVDPERLKVLADANGIAEEWVTPMRMTHVLQKFPRDVGLQQTKDVISAMIEDVIREAKGEIVDSPEARRAIGKKAAELFKARVLSGIETGRDT